MTDDQLPAVLTPADLHLTWRALMGDVGFSERTLWLLFIGPGGRPLGPLLDFADLPDGPHGLEVDALADLCRDLLEGPGGGRGSVAMLITRPGTDPWHVGDRAWARYLTAIAHRIGGQVWPLHRANDRELVVVPDPGQHDRASA
ncbi:hypothetical protein [Marmoricola sp. URHA0025 HA25]